MKIRTSELLGAALDWAVARANGITDERIVLQSRVQLPGEKAVRQEARVRVRWLSKKHTPPELWAHCAQAYSPSTIWAHGGPIIEREGIDIRQAKQALFSHYTYYRPEHFPDAEIIMRPNDRGPDRALRVRNKPHPLHEKWMAKMSSGTSATVQWSKTDFVSDTPLQAAMRCYVASKLGEEVDIPKELL